MSNNYSAPASTLVSSTGTANSLEAAMAGDYEFSAIDTIGEAFKKTKGIKRYIIGAGILLYVAMIVVFTILAAVSGLSGSSGGEPSAAFGLTAVVIQLVMMAVMMPFAAGLFIICLKHLQNQPVSFGDAFAGFAKTGPLLVAMILITILVFAGMMLLIIPGIYLSYCYFMVIPLMVDRDLGPWEAMEASRKATTKSWFRVFGMYLLLLLIMFVSMIPFGIGLIWTMPMMIMAFAIMYQKMFGITSY